MKNKNKDTRPTLTEWRAARDAEKTLSDKDLLIKFLREKLEKSDAPANAITKYVQSNGWELLGNDVLISDGVRVDLGTAMYQSKIGADWVSMDAELSSVDVWRNRVNEHAAKNKKLENDLSFYENEGGCLNAIYSMLCDSLEITTRSKKPTLDDIEKCISLLSVSFDTALATIDELRDQLAASDRPSAYVPPATPTRRCKKLHMIRYIQHIQRTEAPLEKVAEFEKGVEAIILGKKYKPRGTAGQWLRPDVWEMVKKFRDRK